MAIEFVNSASTALASSSAISITRPTNSTAGDLLVAHIFVEDNTDRITSTRVPAGWSTAVNQTVGTRAVRQYVHYKVLTTSEPSSYTWYLDSADEVIGMISAYRGADLLSPIGNIAVSTVNAQTTSVAAPEITVQTAGNWAVICAGNAAGSTIAGSWVPPTSFTERVDTQTSTGGANISAVMADFSPASTGATGAKTYSAPVADYYVASLIEIKQFDPLVTLTVTDGAVVSSAEEASLSQEQNIAVSDGIVSQFAESADLIQEHNLIATDGAVASVGENVVLEVIAAAGDITLFASDYISASAADPTTAQLTAPAGKDAGTDFEAGLISDDTNPLPSIDLGQDKYTEIEFCIKAGAGASGNYEFRITSNGTPLTAYLQTPTLTVSITDTLIVADGYSASVADTAEVEQEHLLVATDAASASVAESAVLVQEHNLAASDAAVAAVADSAVLEIEHVVGIADGVVKTTADDGALEQEHNLALSDGVVKSAGDVITLGAEGLDTIAPDDGVVKTVSDSLELVQEHNLVNSDGVVKTVSDTVDLISVGLDTLVVQDGVVKAVAESAQLSEDHNLVVLDGNSKAVVEALILLQEHELSVSDCFNPNHVDDVSLEIEHWLEISNAAVVAAADFVRIYSLILGPIIDPYILSVTARRDMHSITPAYMVKSATTRRTIEQGDI